MHNIYNIQYCISLIQYIYIYTRIIKCFQPFFVWAVLLIVHT